MMSSVAVVEPTRAAIPIAVTATAITVSVAVSRASFVEPTRTSIPTIAVATVIRAAAAPRIGMEAGAASTGYELDHSFTPALFEGVEREVSGIGRGRQTEPGNHHGSYSQYLHALHDLNLVGGRPQPWLFGET